MCEFSFFLFPLTAGCVAVAMESGVRFYNVEPLAERGRIGQAVHVHVCVCTLCYS